MKKKIPLFVFIDSSIVFIAFLLAAFFKIKGKVLFNHYWEPFLIFLGVWIITSIIFGKYNLLKFQKMRMHFPALFQSNGLILLIFTFIIYYFELSYSHFLLTTTVLIATFLESILSALYINFGNAKDAAQHYAKFKSRQKKIVFPSEDIEIDENNLKTTTKVLVSEVGNKATDFIARNANLGIKTTKILATTTKFNILDIPSQSTVNQLINIKPLNDVGRINKFVETINSVLPLGGIYIGQAKLSHTSKKNILNRYPLGIRNLMYLMFFLVHRVLPKLYLTRSTYFFFTKGKGRVLSKAETLGRLYSCGFEVLDEQLINGQLYFACRKIDEPVFDESPTYGPFIRLNRYGKGGKMIGVYKMRTMHPYSEYLQDYIFKKYNLKKGGKFSNDFRITSVGKIMRKFWLDELPMFINVFKGEMKIVGVRPLSKHYFNLYTEELKARRTKYKPGLVPPFYVDMPETLEEIMASENKYLEAYEKHPFRTDVSYFFQALYNILIKKARSQ